MSLFVFLYSTQRYTGKRYFDQEWPFQDSNSNYRTIVIINRMLMNQFLYEKKRDHFWVKKESREKFDFYRTLKVFGKKSIIDGILSFYWVLPMHRTDSLWSVNTQQGDGTCCSINLSFKAQLNKLNLKKNLQLYVSQNSFISYLLSKHLFSLFL